MKFHEYLSELRKSKFSNISKLCKILKIKPSMWRKLERGINPPPKRILLSRFCLLANVKEYEKNQLYALAKRWEPHKDENTQKHNLWNENLGAEWLEALLEENTPDYPNKYWSKNK